MDRTPPQAILVNPAPAQPPPPGDGRIDAGTPARLAAEREKERERAERQWDIMVGTAYGVFLGGFALAGVLYVIFITWVRSLAR